jgi:hypothetical protein
MFGVHSELFLPVLEMNLGLYTTSISKGDDSSLCSKMGFEYTAINSYQGQSGANSFPLFV